MIFLPQTRTAYQRCAIINIRRCDDDIQIQFKTYKDRFAHTVSQFLKQLFFIH
jgi:hypothetical protein